MRLIPIKKLTSKLIRSGLTTREAITAKMLKGANESELKRLGTNIKGLTNIKLKSMMLRVIQGDVYCGSRLKKFGMTDTDGCPRCGQSEDIDHQLFSCHYTKILWSLVSGITGIPNNNLSNVLGISDFHDKSTLTLHAELIRILMAIDRPITPQTELVQQTLERLNILEKGVTKHQMNEMIKIITRNNGLVGMSWGPVLNCTGLIWTRMSLVDLRHWRWNAELTSSQEWTGKVRAAGTQIHVGSLQRPWLRHEGSGLSLGLRNRQTCVYRLCSWLWNRQTSVWSMCYWGHTGNSTNWPSTSPFVDHLIRLAGIGWVLLTLPPWSCGWRR